MSIHPSQYRKVKSARNLTFSRFCCFKIRKNVINHLPNPICKKCKKSGNSKRSICIEHFICSACLISDSVSIIDTYDLKSNHYTCYCVNFMNSKHLIEAPVQKNKNNIKSKYQKLNEENEPKSNNKVNSTLSGKEKKIDSINQVKKNQLNSIDKKSKQVTESTASIKAKKIEFDDGFIKEILYDLIFSILEHEKNISKESELLEDVFNSLNSFNSLDSLSHKCSICEIKNKVKGFICNHNICEKCLALGYAETFISFRNNYTSDTDHNLKFLFFCPVKNCHQTLSVPSLMMIKNIRSLLKDDQFKKENQNFLLFEDDSINDWIPFLDGINLFAAYS